MKNKNESIRIVVSYAHTERAHIELVVGDNETYYFTQEELHITKIIFSEELLQAAVDWLQKGWFNSYAHNNFKRNY